MNIDLVSFKLWLVQSGRKSSTIQLYLRALTRLVVACPAISKDEITTFYLKLKEENKRHSYINAYTDALRIYNQFRPVPYLPNYFKDQATIKATLSDEEIEAFLTLPCPVCRKKSRNGVWTKRITDPVGWSNWTMFWNIMAFTGMRTGEVASLTVDTIDWGRHVFTLEDTKTNTPRYVPIPPHLTDVMRIYVRNLKGNYLFPARRKGEGVVRSVDWGYSFHKRLRILSIKRRGLTPYSLRHSFITRMLEEDVNIFKVQKIVGHRQLSTTAGYTHLTTKDIIKVIKRDRLTLKRDPIQIIKVLREYIEDMNLDPTLFIFHFTQTSVLVRKK